MPGSPLSMPGGAEGLPQEEGKFERLGVEWSVVAHSFGNQCSGFKSQH